jgi:glucosamine-phosphate N-acetyltransferase
VQRLLRAFAALRESGLTTEEASQILRARPENVRTFVLLAEGQVAATATLVVEKKFIHRGGVAGHVEDVATRPEFGGRGYATMLLEHLLAEARAEGCYKFILDCDPELVSFYQRLGCRDCAVCMRIDL